MKYLRLSFLYPITYLFMAGLNMAFLPDLALKLMLSNGNYELLFVRLTGVFLLGLAVIVLQIFRHKTESLYKTIIGVRGIFLTSYVVFYSMTKDPFFLMLFGIVGFGVILSTTAYLKDRKSAN